MSELFIEFRDMVAKTNDGTWCSQRGLEAHRHLNYFGPVSEDAQADFVGLLMDELERLRWELEKLDEERDDWREQCRELELALWKMESSKFHGHCSQCGGQTTGELEGLCCECADRLTKGREE